jgi:hypothetical protein
MCSLAILTADNRGNSGNTVLEENAAQAASVYGLFGEEQFIWLREQPDQ